MRRKGVMSISCGGVLSTDVRHLMLSLAIKLRDSRNTRQISGEEICWWVGLNWR